MADKKYSSVQRVEYALKSQNIPTNILNLPNSTRTAKEAASAVNCIVGQIVKSLVFQSVISQQPILILTSGSNQVDEKLVGSQIGEQIQFAPAEFVREKTGFAIGGVSPVGLKKEFPIYFDQDLLQYELIWAAAGSHQAVFSIQPQVLVNSTGAIIIAVQ